MPTTWTQSTYWKYHSTETAVTRVYIDLLLAADRGQLSAYCLLDLTAAFDTVDHELLLLRLERQFGLRGTALMWFRSCLSESCTPVVPHLLCTSSVKSHKAQSLAQYCSCCTWLTLQTLSTDTVSPFTRLPMIRSCTCIAAVKTPP